jgi:thiol-disulfide isomerase/thioredoxin
MLSLAAAPLTGASASAPEIPSLREVRARDFKVVDLNGSTIALASVLGNGQPSVIEFWATWCVPCRKTLPHLITLKRENHDSLAVVGLTVEDPAVDLQKVRSYAAEQGINFPVAFAPPELFQFMNNRQDIAVPKLFVFDGAGDTVAYIPRYSPFTGRKLESAVRLAVSRAGTSHVELHSRLARAAKRIQEGR